MLAQYSLVRTQQLRARGLTPLSLRCPFPQPRLSAAAQRELFFNYATANTTALYPTNITTTSSNSTSTPVGYVLSSDATLNTQLGNSEGAAGPVPGNEMFTALLANLTAFATGRFGNNRWVKEGQQAWTLNQFHTVYGMQLGKVDKTTHGGRLEVDISGRYKRCGISCVLPFPLLVASLAPWPISYVYAVEAFEYELGRAINTRGEMDKLVTNMYDTSYTGPDEVYQAVYPWPGACAGARTDGAWGGSRRREGVTGGRMALADCGPSAWSLCRR